MDTLLIVFVNGSNLRVKASQNMLNGQPKFIKAETEVDGEKKELRINTDNILYVILIS